MASFKDLLHDYSEVNVDKLSWLAWTITIGHMTLMWWTFVDGSNPVPEGLIYLLWVVLAVYAAPKEIVRWHTKKGQAPKKRLGHIVVPIWVASLWSMGYLEWKNPDIYQIPRGMTETVVGVMIIFAASTTSKKLHKYRRCPPHCEDEVENKESTKKADPKSSTS